MYIIIVGCGRVGSQLAEGLSAQGHDLVVIDRQPAAFERLGSGFNGITVEGVGFDQEVLKRAGIERADAFIAVTDLDNTNMMAAEVATKIFEVPRVIARLYNPEKERTYQELGIDYVCGTIVLSDEILDMLIPGHVRHLPLMRDADIVQFKAGPNVVGQQLAQLEMPGVFRIVGVVRKGDSYIPADDAVIDEDDVIVGVVKKDSLKLIQKFSETRIT